MHPQHARHAGSVEVHIEQADFVAEAGQRQRQVHRRHALADAAFAAHDHELVLDPGHAGLDLLHLLGDLLDDLGVVAVLQPAEDRFEVFVSHSSYLFSGQP